MDLKSKMMKVIVGRMDTRSGRVNFLVMKFIFSMKSWRKFRRIYELWVSVGMEIVTEIFGKIIQFFEKVK